MSEKSHDARNGRSLFFDYVKSSLHDNSIREYQGFDSCSDDNVVNDILVTTANDIYLDERIQSDAHAMRGLQESLEQYLLLHGELCIVVTSYLYLDIITSIIVVYYYIFGGRHLRNLIPLISTMLKPCIKMFNLICSDHNFLLETVDTPIILLLQPDPLHHLTYFEFNRAIFWMIMWLWDNGEISGTDTVCHRVVDVHTLMRGEVVPDKYLMKVSARDIVRLNIPADIITKISQDIDCCSNSTPVSDPLSRLLNATTNM